MRLAALLPLAAALACALALAGCSVEEHVSGPAGFSPYRPDLPSREPWPALVIANSPTNAIVLFGAGWNRKDLGVFEGLLTADFDFVFALGDSAGSVFHGAGIGRDEMLAILDRIFNGGGAVPPATRIDLVLDPVLRALPDSRPGRHPKWHREILTSVDLTLELEGGEEYRVLGHARFFVVRGDSARVPAGVAADSTRWFIQQWHDETLQGGGGTLSRRAGAESAQAPLPAHNTSWGQILALYYYPEAPPTKGP